MGSLKFSFPEEMLKPIRQAVIGFISQLKDRIVNGFGSAVNRMRGNTAKNNAEINSNSNSPQNNNNFEKEAQPN